jgi:hypothetical protein
MPGLAEVLGREIGGDPVSYPIKDVMKVERLRSSCFTA